MSHNRTYKDIYQNRTKTIEMAPTNGTRNSCVPGEHLQRDSYDNYVNVLPSIQRSPLLDITQNTDMKNKKTSKTKSKKSVTFFPSIETQSYNDELFDDTEDSFSDGDLQPEKENVEIFPPSLKTKATKTSSFGPHTISPNNNTLVGNEEYISQSKKHKKNSNANKNITNPIHHSNNNLTSTRHREKASYEANQDLHNLNSSNIKRKAPSIKNNASHPKSLESQAQSTKYVAAAARNGHHGKAFTSESVPGSLAPRLYAALSSYGENVGGARKSVTGPKLKVGQTTGEGRVMSLTAGVNSKYSKKLQINTAENSVVNFVNHVPQLYDHMVTSSHFDMDNDTRLGLRAGLANDGKRFPVIRVNYSASDDKHRLSRSIPVTSHLGIRSVLKSSSGGLTQSKDSVDSSSIRSSMEIDILPNSGTKVKISKSVDYRDDRSYKYDYFTANIEPIPSKIKCIKNADMQLQRQRFYDRQAFVNAMSRTTSTIPTDGLDVIASMRETHKHETHSAFSSARIPTRRRNPTLITWPKCDRRLLSELSLCSSITSSTSQTSSTSSMVIESRSGNLQKTSRVGVAGPLTWDVYEMFGTVRVDSCNRGHPRFYPWAPFDPLLVQQTCCELSHAGPPPHLTPKSLKQQISSVTPRQLKSAKTSRSGLFLRKSSHALFLGNEIPKKGSEWNLLTAKKRDSNSDDDVLKPKAKTFHGISRKSQI